MIGTCLRSPARICGTLALCACILARAAETPTQPASPPPERFFSTEGVGCEILNEKLPVRITGDQAAQLFKKDAQGKLVADWQEHLPAAAIQPAPGAFGLPNDPKFLAIMQHPSKTEPVATVAKFSDKNLVIRISKPAGNYLWHAYHDNVATLQVERNPALDDLFDLTTLTKAYATPYKGIEQGDTESRMRDVLGRPDRIRITQSETFAFAEYEKGAIEIAIWNGRVFQVRHVPDGELRARKAAEEGLNGK